MVRISVIKKGKNNMSDKFNIEGMRVEFEDGLIDKLMQESGIDAVKEITKVLKGEKNMTAKIGDKLIKVNESFTINMYDNGYMIEVNGRDDDDEWNDGNGNEMMKVDQGLESVSAPSRSVPLPWCRPAICVLDNVSLPLCHPSFFFFAHPSPFPSVTIPLQH